MAPRTLTRGSRGHLSGLVTFARRDERRGGTQRERRSARPLTWDGLAGGARKGLATHGAGASASEQTPAGFGEPEVVLGDPHSCRNRRTARGPAAPGEQPVKRLDLARCKRVNACRKRGPGGKARCTRGGSGRALTRQQGGMNREIRRWKTLRARKAAALACRLWNGFLVPSKARSATEGRVGRAARQGASGVWSAASCKADKAECEERREERNSPGHGPDGGRLMTGSSWRERCQARRHSRSDGPRGRSAPPCTERIVPAPAKQPAKRGGPGSGSRQGASPVLESVGSPGCS